MTFIVSRLRVPYRIVSLPENPLCSMCSSRPPLKPLTISDLFLHHHSLFFSRMSLAGLLQSVAFSEWLLSVSHTPLSFLHVFVVFFLLLNNIPLHDVPQFALLVASKLFFFFQLWIKLLQTFVYRFWCEYKFQLIWVNTTEDNCWIVW